MNSIFIILVIAILALLIGFAGGSSYRKKTYEKSLDSATQTAEGIVATAKKEAEAQKKKLFWKQKRKVISIAAK